jgi:hypothetical protein
MGCDVRLSSTWTVLVSAIGYLFGAACTGPQATVSERSRGSAGTPSGATPTASTDVGKASAAGAGRASAAPAAAPTDRVAAALRSLLEPQSGGASIKTSSYEGALGTTVVMASIDGAYPGTGVYRAVVDEKGVSFGVHGDRSLADLVRTRGWLVHPPDEEPFTRLVNDAQFDGVALIDSSRPHGLRVLGGELVLEFVRRTFPSGAFEPTRIRFGPSGPPIVEAGTP